jgi:integrase
MPQKIPTYRLHKPSGQAVVTLNGRDFYLGEWNSAESRTEFERLLAEWLSNGHRLPSASRGGGLTLAELLAAYLRFAKEYYSENGEPTSEYTCMKDAARPLRELYSRAPVQDFGPLALKAVRQRMIDSGLCRALINRRVNRLRRVFKWGVENELVPAAVLHALQAVAPLKQGRCAAPESKPVRPVPDEHVAAILPHVARQVVAMIQPQQLTGMRPGEVTIMRPCDVERTGNVWVYRPMRHKTQHRGYAREVFLDPKAQRILEAWLDRDCSSYCFSPGEAEAERSTARRQNRKTPMTPNQEKRRPKASPKRAKRDRYDRDSYRRAVKYGIKKAGVPHWHPHQLRHSCGTRLRRDYGLDTAQVILGHRTAAVTEIYAEADRAKAVAVIATSG